MFEILTQIKANNYWHIMPFILSIITIIQMIMVGNKNKNGWLLNTLNQTLWAFWAIVDQSYGFLILQAVLTYVSVRNYILWSKNGVSQR